MRAGLRLRPLPRAGRLLIAGFVPLAVAGPPYVSDDPQPTDYRHYEIYLLTEGTRTDDGTAGASGIDFNYGATAPAWEKGTYRFIDGFHAGIGFIF